MGTDEHDIWAAADVANLGDFAALRASAIRKVPPAGEVGTADLPREILFPGEFADRGTVEELLTGAAGEGHEPGQTLVLRCTTCATVKTVTCPGMEHMQRVA